MKTGDIGPFKLTFNGNPLDLSLKLGQSGLKNNSVIQIESINKYIEDKISLLFERSDGLQKIIRISPNSLVSEAITEYKNKIGNQGKMLFIYDSRRLDEKLTLAQARITNNSKILVINMIW